MPRLNAATKAVLDAFPRPAPRPITPERLTASTLLSLEIVNQDTFNQLAFGKPTAQTVWDWVGNVLLWSRAADLLELGQDEMCAQLQGCVLVIDRLLRTGRAGFDGPGLRLARHGVDVMNELARQVDAGTAHEAAVWAEKQLARIRVESPGAASHAQMAHGDVVLPDGAVEAGDVARAEAVARQGIGAHVDAQDRARDACAGNGGMGGAVHRVARNGEADSLSRDEAIT